MPVMSDAMDLVPLLNSSCSECWDLGPPPDTILNIPPPPLPAFLQRPPSNHTTPPCTMLCDWNTGQGVEFIELPIQGTGLDDTWLLVLITSCVGVLLLGSLFALVVLKCREERSAKVTLQMEGQDKGCEAVLYPVQADNRVLWATITPRGTMQHFTVDAPPIKSFDNSAFIDPDEYMKIRPRVSSPTRIENPNLPPLNLHRTLRRTHADNPPVV